MAKVMMWMNNLENFFVVKILILRNMLQNSSIIRKSLLRKRGWFLVQYLSQEMISEGRSRPPMCYFVWLLML